jgi:16S rRNA (adenine1518-N6/adenine1519-N6)-dimethyltransferase
VAEYGARRPSAGSRPNKRLGQHFLRDRRVVHRIIAKAGVGKEEKVLEIGAGTGVLTIPLARSVDQVIAVEKDLRLVDRLRPKLARLGIDNVVLINEDILRIDLDRIWPGDGSKLKVIGNLPYNISTPLLEKLMANRHRLSRAVLMFQAELAKRLIGTPGTKAYGAMSVLIQYNAYVAPLLKVPRTAFYPMPRIDSMVLELDFERSYPRKTESEENFRQIVKASFAHRRKTLLNSLRTNLPALSDEDILNALKQCTMDPRQRAESYGIDDFLCLSAALLSLS